MKYITKEVRIGIAGIAALCILVYGINYLKGINMLSLPVISMSNFRMSTDLPSLVLSLPTVFV